MLSQNIYITCTHNHDLVWLLLQGMQNFGGIRVGNGPTEDEAGIIEHDQLSQNLEDESPEVREFSFFILSVGFSLN